MGQRCRDGDVEPVGDRCRVSKRTDPEAVTNAVPDVVRGQRDEQHPGQGAPRVLQSARPHEEAQREAQRWDQCGAVQGRSMGQIQSSLWGGSKKEHQFKQTGYSKNMVFIFSLQSFAKKISLSFKFFQSIGGLILRHLQFFVGVWGCC